MSSDSSSKSQRRFSKKGWKILGIDGQDAIRYFFGGNATLAIFILVLICAFLLREAAGFFPEHHQGLKNYRKSGIEYYDHIDSNYKRYKIWRGGLQRAFTKEYQAPANNVLSRINAYCALTTHLEHSFKSDFHSYKDIKDLIEEGKDLPRLESLLEKFSQKIRHEAKQEFSSGAASKLKELRGFSEQDIQEMTADIVAHLPEVEKSSEYLAALEAQKKEIDAQSWEETSYLNKHFLDSKKLSKDYNKLWKSIFKHSVDVRNEANTAYTVPNRIRGQINVGLAKAQRPEVRQAKLRNALQEVERSVHFVPLVRAYSITLLQEQLGVEVDRGILPAWYASGSAEQWEGFLNEVSALGGHKMNEKQRATFLKLVQAEKGDVQLRMLAEVSNQFLIEYPFDEKSEAVYATVSSHGEAVSKMKAELQTLVASLPEQLNDPEAQKELDKLRSDFPDILQSLDKTQNKLEDWRHDRPYSFGRSLAEFFMGKKWANNSSTQDRYGIVPLLVGSLIISGIAIVVAVPIAISAAIYVNQIAGSRTREFFKPAIEFIGAIPSIVLGFFGIAVLGHYLKATGDISWLSWIPGFPMESRLNMLAAGLLLAFMASPTIFTLAEDALRNVPKAFTQGSLALGATKLQTALKVVFPAASSGIIAAILLGFGRVIGETMVVLLVAGNRVSLPDFSKGIGVVTQPSHTMTGMIAQGLGEAPVGSVGYRALFMIGFVLFMISLVINFFAQRVVSKYQRT